MDKCEDVIPIYELRPILRHEKADVFRYADGEWISDDGEFDIAFAQPDSGTAWAFHVPYRKAIVWSWAKNGRWGAHVPEHPRGNAWHYMLRDGETEWGKSWQRHRHLNEKVAEEARRFAMKNGCSCSTSGPEFKINDPYIAKGLLRIKETKEIIAFPDSFNCMYCGEIDWRKEEEVD